MTTTVVILGVRNTRGASFWAATAAAILALAVQLGARQAPTFTYTVNNGIRYQTLLGWGGTFSGNRNLNHVPQEVMDQIIDEAVDDLGLTFIRIQDGVLSEPFNDNNDSNVINWSGFYDTAAIDLEVARGLGRFVSRVRAKGRQPVVLLDRAPISAPPVWLTPAEAAEQILANILYYKTKHGIDITFVPIERDPNAASASYQRSVINELGPKLLANGLSTKVVLNEASTAETAWATINALRDDAGVMQHVGLFSWHGYGTPDPFRALIRDAGLARGVPIGMTENAGGRIGNLIDDLNAGASYWARNTILDSGPATAGTTNNYFATNADGVSFVRNQDYWAFRNVMNFIQPGSVRVEATTSNPAVKIMAFDNGQFTQVVLFNSSNQSLRPPIAASANCAKTLPNGWTLSHDGDVGQIMGPGSVWVYWRFGSSRVTPVFPQEWKASPNPIALPNTTTMLTANAFGYGYENDGAFFTRVRFDWELLSGPPGGDVSIHGIGFLAENTLVERFTVPGMYVFKMTATGLGCCTSPSSREYRLRVYDGNQAPVITEGARYYHQEWIIQPETSQTHGPDFISAFDIENDPFTTSYSVVSQPQGANARFEGSTAVGMTAVGDYVFRFTARDATHSVTRDFTRRVVAGQAGDRGRRPAGAPSLGNAVPRKATTTAAPAASTQSAATTPATRSIAPAAPAKSALQMALERLIEIDGNAGGSGWSRIVWIDNDEDGTFDAVVVEFLSGEVFRLELVGSRGRGHGGGR